MHEIERLLKGFERFQQHYFEDEPELFDTITGVPAFAGMTVAN
ncbi:hypothetical protein LMG23994_06614 [Cupriavidus pinatubonensis]|uniref:Uncharacterized protein n=1 Tax=Cupriavidus pinatubonensis TaxID=248026 RepID=A0ABM8Y335_9BURK|nr:hypothetical protein LMG23994_06614 [Cupriavidus pinatubonensis]